MAYRRSLTTTRSRLFAQRLTPSISYFNHDEDRKSQQHSDENIKSFLQSRSYGVFRNITNTLTGFGPFSWGSPSMKFRDPRWYHFSHVPMTSGFLLSRNMSSTIGNGDGDAVGYRFEYMDELADFLAEEATETVSTQAAPVLSEVAVAAADSWLPVATLQYAIDGIHVFTGLNWWASIVITTLIIRTLLVPFMIYQMKGSIKHANMRPIQETITQKLQNGRISQFEFQERITSLYQEHGVSFLTPFKGILFQAPIFISFFLAIQNMVEKVPSFKTGGASWFLDLTTADSFYVLPCLAAFSSWILVEFNMQEGMEDRANNMKNLARVFAVLSIPFMASLPKAVFCYWITSNLFSLVYGLIIKQDSAKKFLNIPEVIPPPPPAADQFEPAFSWKAMIRSSNEAIKRSWEEETEKLYATQGMQQQQEAKGSKPTILSKILNLFPLLRQVPSSEEKRINQISSSSSSPLALGHKTSKQEKRIKRKKNKKR